MEKIFRQPVNTMGSGRTDTGVHAEQQFVQADLDIQVTDDHIFKLNCVLPKDIAVHGFYKVKPEANARFDAISRTYEYRISRTKNPFLSEHTYFFGKDLDVVKMNKAAATLKKHKDFESFSKVKTSTEHFLCDIYKAEWVQENDLLIFRIEANRFLRGMVRTLVGTILEIGLGRLKLSDLEKIIKSKDRRMAGRAAPPEGLFLTKIKYPKKIFER